MQSYADTTTHDISLLLQAPAAQATACCKLGVLYHQQGRLEQAVSYFERFYELARSLGECMQQRV
jgi:tetratricopeptide (TPR) repeat protein